MQNIAAENFLPETAFFVKEKSGHRIRWFTPSSEINLCGHATLASAYVLFNFIDPSLKRVDFQSMSGPLSVLNKGEALTMDFPAWESKPVPCPDFIVEALSAKPSEFYLGQDAMAVFERAEQIVDMNPDIAQIGEYKEGRGGFLVTAPGYGDYDFVSRAFFPRLGIPEDPVTGAAHCALTPYWTKRLNKTKLKARQVSKRGGDLLCELKGARVEITGEATLYLKGEIYI